ncbi:MAG: phosphopantothenoylcysteine decarboxylase domain-containing protein [Planctomycetota bacterium]
MRLLVTAGGTREPIDSARVIANTSTGRLGARIAEVAVERGLEVVLLHGVLAARPSLSAPDRMQSFVFDRSAELAALLEAHAPGVDAVVHAAAVSDYLPIQASGKLSSDQPELVLRLQRAPKLIDRLRTLNPTAFLVGFKLTSGLSPAAQLQKASELLRRARLDLVVANDSAQTSDQDHAAIFVTASGVIARAQGKAAVARALVEQLVAQSGRQLPVR